MPREGLHIKLTPVPKEEAPETLPQETKEGADESGVKNSEGAAEAPESFLNSENQDILDGMSEDGKKIFSDAHEGFKILGADSRIVGKLGIAYNQFWADRHEKKAVQFKSKLGAFDLKIGALEQSKKEIESVIENFKQQNTPGTESLQLKVRDIDQQRAGLLNERDETQSKLEARENKARLYTNDRDKAADRFIERYNEKLRPMEQELEKLQTARDQAELLAAVTEVKHREQTAKLGDIEKRKTQLEEALRRAGTSEKEIGKFEAVKVLAGLLVQGRENIRAEQAALSRRKEEINKKVAEIDAKANSYRDKRGKFVRIKEGRPLKMEVPTREREKEFKDTEATVAHGRTEGVAGRDTYAETATEMTTGSVAERAEQEKKRWTTASYVSGWNEYLQQQHGKNVPGGLINVRDFLKSTGLSADYELDFKDFTNILARYYKFKKMPINIFNQNIDKFFDEKIKEKTKAEES